MKTLFKEIVQKNPNKGMVICLAETIKLSKNVKKQEINELFKLVPKDEYPQSEKDGILNFLYNLA